MTGRPVTYLLADIGGTNARFALSRDGTMFGFKALPVVGFAGFGPALEAYLETQQPQPLIIDQALLAVAGPVAGNRCALTNSPWVVDGSLIERDFGIGRVTVYNDLEAVAWALSALRASDCISLGDGHAVLQAPQAIVAPGTGLGIAAWLGNGCALASEGGHASFAPEDSAEDRLLQALRLKHGHVSGERLLSAGLVAIYAALAEQAGQPAALTAASDITAQAIAGACALSHAAVMQFCAILGSVAGNLALTFNTRGGIYIAGGIAPRILPLLARSPFRQRFAAKGRLSDWLVHIPTKVIQRPDVALVGLWERHRQENLA